MKTVNLSKSTISIEECDDPFNVKVRIDPDHSEIRRLREMCNMNLGNITKFNIFAKNTEPNNEESKWIHISNTFYFTDFDDALKIALMFENE